MTDDLSARKRAKNLELKSAVVIRSGTNVEFEIGTNGGLREVAF